MKATKNKYRHKWVDKQIKQTGTPSYAYTCKKCGCMRYKQDFVSYEYRTKNEEITNEAPECVPV